MVGFSVMETQQWRDAKKSSSNISSSFFIEQKRSISEELRRRPEGGEWERNKILSQESDLCSTFKTPERK
jgi:hypothetical protein